MPAPYGGHWPRRIVGGSSDSERLVISSRSSRDLPTPAWPITVTRCGRSSRSTRSTSDISRPASSSRPINGVCARPAPWRGSATHAVGLPGGHRLLLALQAKRLEPLEGDRLAAGAVGRLADRDGVGPARGLEARRHVDRVAHHGVAVADRSRHHLAGVDADAEREAHAELLAALAVRVLHRLLHGEAGPHGALGIVLVGDRSAEDAHHVVADELVDRSAEALDLAHRARAGCDRRGP